MRDLDAGDNGHGGGAVEAVFWIREAMCQWRVRGRGIILGSCSGEGEKEEKARREVAQWMRRKTTSPSGSGSGSGSAEKEKEWTWDRMVDTYFANHSPILRGSSLPITHSVSSSFSPILITVPVGSFKAPAPGQVRGALPPDSELGIGLKVDDIYDSVARRNFRVVVIVPDMVERLDLNDYEKPMRTRWFLNEGGNGWNEAEVWP